MNGIHDMAGYHGFGRVDVEDHEPVFHSRWEGRVYALTQVLDTKEIYNLDEHRHEIELMEPDAYLRDGYYGRWLFAMASILNRNGILLKEEVDRRVAELKSGSELSPPEKKGRNWPLPEDQKVRWGAWRKEQDSEIRPKFKLGDKVRTINHQPPGHTRLTAYIRGKTGIVAVVNEHAWVYPDTRAHNAGENLQPVYTVAFSSTVVWGDQAEENTQMNVDLMEDYLERVE